MTDKLSHDTPFTMQVVFQIYNLVNISFDQVLMGTPTLVTQFRPSRYALLKGVGMMNNPFLLVLMLPSKLEEEGRGCSSSLHAASAHSAVPRQHSVKSL
jgi:hypothetical protein